MNYLVISDTHSMGMKMIDLFNKYKGYKIIHLGDYEDDIEILNKFNVLYVKGNCDYKGEEYKVLNTFDGKFFITHGHLFNVKFKYDNIYYKGLEIGADYVLFGHTHQPLIEKIHGIFLINPGSLKKGTYIVIENKIPILKNDFK